MVHRIFDRVGHASQQGTAGYLAGITNYLILPADCRSLVEVELHPRPRDRNTAAAAGR